jgi:hypothetical protein
MKRLNFIFFSLWITVGLAAQVIHMDFPHFAGKEFIYSLAYGGTNDTIQRGVLDENGQAVLVVPKTHSAYTGMSIFRLIEGGGVDIVLNKEKAFLIRCTEAQPNDENIFYIGSQENHFLHQNYANQEVILKKYDIVRPALDVYSPQDSLYPVFEQENQRLETAYSNLQAQTAKSPLYAARFREMHNFLMGLTDRLNQTEDERKQSLFDFVSKQLNMEFLYTSNLWNLVLDQWMAMQSDRTDSELLLKDTQTILTRISKSLKGETEAGVYKAMLNKIIALYSLYGKDELLLNLGIELMEAGKHAPNLVKGNIPFTPVNSVIIFHESGCDKCENELEQIQSNYLLLKAKGYELISVAADLNKETFEKTTVGFPWQEKLCDYRGFEGVNFKNYGVVGTPTIFVTDKEGKIIERHFSLLETGLLDKE